MTDILALDIATVTGWARGQVGETPEFGSLRFGKLRASNNAVFGQAIRWFAETLDAQPRPDIVIIENLLPPTAMAGKTTADVRDRLCGLQAIARGVCFLRGIYEVQGADVGNVRRHFLGSHALHRDEAKQETLKRCRILGWHAQNTDEADALALWHFGCCLIQPELATQVSPLFNKALRAVG